MYLKMNSKSGMSLLEIVVAMTIFSALMVSVCYMLNSTTRLQSHSVTKDYLRTQAEISLNWIMEQFQDVTEDGIIRARDINGNLMTNTVNFTDAAFVRYKRVLRVVDDGNGVYSREYSTKEYSIYFRLVSGEIDDDLDNNQNGLVDEGEIVIKEYDDASVPDDQGRVVRIISHNAMRKYDRDPSPAVDDIIQGFSISCEADDLVNPSRWMVRVSIALEKIDPSGTFQDGSIFRRTTRVYYKTTTIALYK